MNTIGLYAKRGIEATFEKVVRAADVPGTQRRFIVQWSGTGAGVTIGEQNTIRLTLPNLSESALISRSQFAVLVGFAVHEFGHVRYTDIGAWNKAVEKAGGDHLLHRLINGLEDPRIEQEVIVGGICANARNLFEAVLSSVLLKDYDGGDYVDPDDINNIAFQFAVEGRRLNGYSVPVPPVYRRSKYRDIIEFGLDEARKCKGTVTIISVAEEVLRRLRQRQQEQQQEQQQQQQQDGQPEDRSDDQSGDRQDQQDGQQGDQQGDQQQGDNDGAQQGDQQGDQHGDQQGDDQGKQSLSKKPGGGKGELEIEPSASLFESLAGVVDSKVRPRVETTRIKIQWS